VSEYAAFINAMRAGHKMRARMFDTIEQRHTHDFGSGEDGKRLYEALLAAVRDCGDPQAAEEFESRFLPLLNPDRSSREDAIGSDEEKTEEEQTENRWRGGWLAAACVAAIAFGALLLVNGLRVKTADRPSIAASSIPAAHATVSPDTINEAAPEREAEAPTAVDGSELVAPDTMTGTSQAPATEPALNTEH
jgi:hypothetical protein